MIEKEKIILVEKYTMEVLLGEVVIRKNKQLSFLTESMKFLKNSFNTLGGLRIGLLKQKSAQEDIIEYGSLNSKD